MTEPLVFVPGFGADSRLFAPQIELLSRRMPVTVLPSAQGERVEEMASTVLPLLPPKFALAGHGFGGMIAMEILRRAPDRVLRIALMSTSPLADTPAEAAAREPRIIAAKAGRMADVVSGEVPPGAIAPGPDRVHHHAALMAMAKDLGADALIRQIRAMQRRKDQQAVVRKCRAPAMVLCGDRDSLHPVKRQSFLAELIPHAELRVIEDAGHLPTLEAPHAVNEALLHWLRQPMVLR